MLHIRFANDTNVGNGEIDNRKKRMICLYFCLYIRKNHL